MLDVGWVKKSFDTVMSDEWKNSAKEEVNTYSRSKPQPGLEAQTQGPNPAPRSPESSATNPEPGNLTHIP